MHSITRARERFVRPTAHHAPESTRRMIDLAPLLGSWINFDAQSAGIARAEISEEGGEVIISPLASAGSDRSSWGAASATIFSSDVALHTAIGLRAAFDLGFQHVLLVGYVNRGLLTLEAATTFVDGSQRSRYFTRQHYYRLPL